jgi:hypothetical protein
MGAVMSDRVTWETCSTCGELAALGWTLVEGAHGEPVGEVLVEIDCPSCCRVVPLTQRAAVHTPV